MTKEQAFHSFWADFGWPTYDENTVPESASLPRLTYEMAVGEFDFQVSLTASLWDRSTSWASVTSKSEEIYAAIGMGGKIIPFDGGAIWITRGLTFAQRLSDEDDSIRRILININAEFLTA